MTAPPSFSDTQSAVQGALELRPDGSLEGWCWCPDRPTERLAVDILDGESVVASLTAELFRRDLADAGIGDGRHAFELTLPGHSSPAGGRLIRGRERVSGAIFGSIVRPAGTDASAGGERTAVERLDCASAELAGLQAGIAALKARVAARRTQSRPARTLDDMAALLQARLAVPETSGPADPAFAAAAMRQALRARFATIDVRGGPAAAQGLVGSVTSIVLLAAPEIEQTIAALRALAGIHGTHGVELVLADDETDARTAMIQSVVHGLRVARAEESQAGSTPAARAALALVEACAVARGTHLVLLAADAACSATAVSRLLELLAAHPDQFVPGAAGRDSLARWGLAAPDSPGHADAADPDELNLALPGSIGLIAAMSRRLWNETGGFDAGMADGMGLECADLALKAWLLGTGIARVTENRHGGTAPPVLPASTPAEAWQAAARFRERWGDLGLEQEMRV